MSATNNVFRDTVKSVGGDTAMIATNRSGELLACVATAQRGRLRPGDTAMMFIRPEALSISAKGSRLTLQYDPQNAVAMPLGALATRRPGDLATWRQNKGTP
ncbi:MAG: hypothetical protein ACC631_04760 [Halocynthiibacter sp.]